LEPHSPAQRSVQAGAQKTTSYQFSNERDSRIMRVVISGAPAQVKTDFPWAARAKFFAKLLFPIGPTHQYRTLPHENHKFNGRKD
jgi:hypothetical protein